MGRYYFKFFKCSIRFNPHNNPMRSYYYSPLFYNKANEVSDTCQRSHSWLGADLEFESRPDYKSHLWTITLNWKTWSEKLTEPELGVLGSSPCSAIDLGGRFVTADNSPNISQITQLRPRAYIPYFRCHKKFTVVLFLWHPAHHPHELGDLKFNQECCSPWLCPEESCSCRKYHLLYHVLPLITSWQRSDRLCTGNKTANSHCLSVLLLTRTLATLALNSADASSNILSRFKRTKRVRLKNEADKSS